MKLHSLPNRHRGFTLVELLTVVVIIVILATLVMGALNGAKKMQAAKLTRTNRQNIEMHLESYRSDNGFVPVGTDVSSKELYKALSGDFTGRGEEEPEGEIYWPELLKEGKNALVGKMNGERVILDGYGVSYRYRSALDIDGNPEPKAKNAEFDVWSLGPDGEPSDLQIDSNLENDETLDDIWN
ncbi:type II secretion system GspH family protein [Akkermansiaceae bacterium]|nr:type II secretion system GspH family protein [Akkermansiaceae bacterium]MDB4286428.1 type II secretion system GspH family protein [bacterium]MDA7629468.1 type II secretion system GspH family protein [Akkermansiaceae bacterium]MDA7683961.1 type II secretion system GspH family protein [Akkermansiaceae bacterium]MDA7863699.1 type II secretion system GspH family protein [Akkermansiaceae bacterium]